MRSQILVTNRPVCCNHGCTNLVIASAGKVTDSMPRWRPLCGTCHKNSYDKTCMLPEGVTPFKTGQCSNSNGRLGFPCATDFSKLPEWAKATTEIDHINGDHADNRLENLQELCPMCHRLKSQKEGDHRRNRPKSVPVLILEEVKADESQFMLDFTD